jgi:hypothetical protein
MVKTRQGRGLVHEGAGLRSLRGGRARQDSKATLNRAKKHWKNPIYRLLNNLKSVKPDFWLAGPMIG